MKPLTQISLLKYLVESIDLKKAVNHIVGNSFFTNILVLLQHQTNSQTTTSS